ncbi:hypothetical protein EVAR_14741_1 [Eumeta japonica]|uniref:Uncharacterized protein n=1 Tax=Eumeta variegata TaxID=151549 RepID=A0A4C1TWP4_EUMVA|nr:hypothetical protein EVAR_14741_1 [Eumeta japonica]
MATSSSGAVFFLGTRAHYQVLQPPDSASYDLKNGNDSTETIYQNRASIQDIWLDSTKDEEIQNSGNYLTGECGKWMNCGRNENRTTAMECNDNASKHTNFDLGTGVTRRLKKNKKQYGSNEQILNGNEEAIEIDPTALNKINDRNTPRPKLTSRPCASFRAFLTSLKSKRKRKLSAEELSYVDNLQNILDMCTYKDSCSSNVNLDTALGFGASPDSDPYSGDK